MMLLVLLTAAALQAPPAPVGTTAELPPVEGPPASSAPAPVPSAAAAEPTASDAYNDCVRRASAEPEAVAKLARQWILQDGGLPARHCLGLAELYGDMPGTAAETFAEAGRISESSGDPFTAALYAQAGNAALLADNAAGAEGYFDRALVAAARRDSGVEPRDRADILIDRARSRTDLNKIDLARADLLEATQLAPKNPFGWLLLASAERRAGNLTGSESAIKEALRLAPDDPEIAREASLIAASEVE